MAGNAREWVQDCYTRNYKDAPEDGSAVESGGCAERVIRGGGWSYDAGYCRSALRSGSVPTLRSNFLGFRVAADLAGHSSRIQEGEDEGDSQQPE